MNPGFIGFVIGLAAKKIGECGYWSAHHPKEPWAAFWRPAGSGFMLAVPVNLAIFVLWYMNLLDEVLDYILHHVPGLTLSEIHLTGQLPVSPQVGILLGIGSDLVAPSFLSLLRLAYRRFRARFLPLKEKEA